MSFRDEERDPDMGRSRVQCPAVSLGTFTVPLRHWETNGMFQVSFIGEKVRGEVQKLEIEGSN